MLSGWGGDVTARTLRALYDDLAACTDLRPGPRVDDVFGRLVRLVVDTSARAAPAVLAHPVVREVVPHLRELCFEGEYQLELAWARRIASSPRPHDELERFPYVDNYRRLSEMERTAMAGVSDRATATLDRVAFVGSGPLPLTSFLLAADGVRVDNLDRDADALVLSRRVADALGITGLEFRHVDVGMTPLRGDVDLSVYDLVVLAALVGLTPVEKAVVLAHLADDMAPGALLLARSARGLRTLLYPEVDAGALAGFDVLGVVHPPREVINSVVLARKPQLGHVIEETGGA